LANSTVKKTENRLIFASYGQKYRGPFSSRSLYEPIVLLHTNPYSSSQFESLNSPLVSIRTQRVFEPSGSPVCHRRKVDVLPSNQCCSDGEGFVLDDEFLSRPIQLLSDLRTTSSAVDYHSQYSAELLYLAIASAVGGNVLRLRGKLQAFWQNFGE